jgi:hypothetical protein
MFVAIDYFNPQGHAFVFHLLPDPKEGSHEA